MKLLAIAVAALGLMLASEDPVNKTCPVANKPAKADVTAKHKLGEKEVTVAFCCGGCKGKFEKDPAKYEEALKKEIKK